MFFTISTTSFLSLLLLISVSVNAQYVQENSGPDDVAIEGYSPVSYFEKGIAERGKPRLSVNHKGKTYYLASAEQVRKFSRDPDKYKPRFELCPYSLTLGRKVSIDPTRFKIIAGTLLLFHNSEELDALKEWNKKDDDLGQLREAEQQYENFQSRRQHEDGDNLTPSNKGNVLDMEF